MTTIAPVPVVDTALTGSNFAPPQIPAAEQSSSQVSNTQLSNSDPLQPRNPNTNPNPTVTVEDSNLAVPTALTFSSSSVRRPSISSSSNGGNSAGSITPVPPPSELPSMPANTDIPVTLLLVSGNRRTMAFSPTTTIQRLKEQIWNTWPDEWKDEQPPSAGFLRIIYRGRICGDGTKLEDMDLSRPPSPPTIVHVSVRPFSAPMDDDVSKSKSKSRSRRARTEGDEVEDEHEGGCCGCIIC